MTGTTGLSAANAALALAAANTGTTTIAKVVGSAADLAALTKGANDTITAASLTANILATALALYALQIYDRVIPNQSEPTLWVLTLGALLAIAFDAANE